MYRSIFLGEIRKCSSLKLNLIISAIPLGKVILSLTSSHRRHFSNYSFGSLGTISVFHSLHQNTQLVTNFVHVMSLYWQLHSFSYQPTVHVTIKFAPSIFLFVTKLSVGYMHTQDDYRGTSVCERKRERNVCAFSLVFVFVGHPFFDEY